MNLLKTILLIGIGGGAGSILRYLTSFMVNRWFGGTYPLATFCVNITGCFIIGLLAGLLDRHFAASPNLKYLFITGFCGGYTTFSAFAYENLSLIGTSNIFTALAYIALSVVTGIAAVWFGLYLSS